MKLVPMRVPIWVQLALLVGSVALLSLIIVAVPTWIYVQSFVSNVEVDSLALAASLYADKIDSQLQLLNTISHTIATRIMIQQSLFSFYQSNTTATTTSATATSIFEPTVTDLESALATSSLTGLLQARIYSRNQTGQGYNGLVSVTGTGFGAGAQNISLPYKTSNGTTAMLGDPESGYPPSLYPNITYQNLGYPNPYISSVPAVSASAFPGVLLSDARGLLLGPLVVNESFALVSLTIPIRSVSRAPGFILGYMTLVAAANSFFDIQTARDGLGSTGIALLVAPNDPSNRFTPPTLPSNATYLPPKGSLNNDLVHYVFPPTRLEGQTDRHDGGSSSGFALSQYPTVLNAYSTYNGQLNNAQAALKTTNERGSLVAVGVARPQTTLVDWVIVVEKAQYEANEPILTLRTILLACAFGTAGLFLFLSIPCAYWSVRPIRRLKMATEQSITVPGFDDDGDALPAASSAPGTLSSASIKGLFDYIQRKLGKPRKPMTQAEIENHRRAFKIPGRVKERRHIITDELTELTEVYNRMTDELVNQYTGLEDQVAKRTHELEISKKAAEAANESKTLFIANISHELKTPLNGIMGICAVCMEENDVLHIQHSLKTLYRSGELLLHLLDDLLSFSKHQISQEIKLEQKEFRLGEVRSQVIAIFEKQAKESKIDLDVVFFDRNAEKQDDNSLTVQRMGMPHAAGSGSDSSRLRNAYVLGDQHRLLQVIINLVSNALKFTAPGGRVQIRIRWGDEIEVSPSPKQASTKSSLMNGELETYDEKASAKVANRDAKETSSPISNTSPDSSERRPVPLLTRSTTNTSPAALDETNKRYMFTFEVEDTGRGIPQDMIDKIFEPFVQVDSSFSKEFGGTGLGLSICSQLATLMKGTVSAKSTEGLGSTFCLAIPLQHVPDRVASTRSESTRPRSRAHSADGSVTAASSHRNSLSSVIMVAQDPDMATADHNHNAESAAHRSDIQPRLVGLSTPFFPPTLPPSSATSATQTTVIAAPSNEGMKHAAIQRAKADKAAASGDEDGSDIRVLVADDNATNVEVVRRMLKLEKVNKVTIARDGREAYEAVKASMQRNDNFDVIFMDVQMPNVDGIQSTKLIREMGYAAPIVALTAFSEESNRKECMESGMNEFLAKPIRRSALKSVLTKFATIYE